MSLSSTKQATANSIATKWVAVYKKYRATGNKTQQEADAELSNMCQDLSNEMMGELYNWVNGAKIAVTVTSIGPAGNTAIHPVASKDTLNKQFALDV